MRNKKRITLCGKMVPESRTESEEEQCTQYYFLILTLCASTLFHYVHICAYVKSVFSEFKSRKTVV